MKYAVDKIENEIITIENIESGIKKEIHISKLPDSIKEGTILVYKNNKYYLDLIEEKIRKKRINSKFSSLIKKSG